MNLFLGLSDSQRVYIALSIFYCFPVAKYESDILQDCQRDTNYMNDNEVSNRREMEVFFRTTKYLQLFPPLLTVVQGSPYGHSSDLREDIVKQCSV